MKGRAARVAVPAIIALRGHFDEVRLSVMAEAGGDADRATRLLVNRLLHDPSEVMKEMAAAAATGGEGWEAAEGMLKRLFRLS